MTREELIAEAANAMSQGYVQDGRISSFFALAEAALSVFENAQAPTDDEREALARTLFIASDDFAFAERMAKAWDAPGPHGRQRWYNYADAILAAGFRRPAQTERSPEFDSLEQELFKHQPVLSMRDGSIAGCQCLDRVFHKDAEDWGTHLAEVFESLRPAQTEPTDAQVEGYHVEIGEQRFTQAQWEAVQRYCEGRPVKQAEAWTKGHAAGRDYQGDGWNCDAHDPELDNPYRPKSDGSE